VRHADPWILRHDLVVKGQDRLVLRLEPSHLKRKWYKLCLNSHLYATFIVFKRILMKFHIGSR
jgi:hypothetical protein